MNILKRNTKLNPDNTFKLNSLLGQSTEVIQHLSFLGKKINNIPYSLKFLYISPTYLYVDI